METPLSTSGNLPPKPGTRAPLQLSGLDFKLLRVFMAWMPLESAVDISTQNLTAPVRTGFTAVEWGGCQVR